MNEIRFVRCAFAEIGILFFSIFFSIFEAEREQKESTMRAERERTMRAE